MSRRKTLGDDHFKTVFNISVEDILRTFVEHIAIQISNNLRGNNLKILMGFHG